MGIFQQGKDKMLSLFLRQRLDELFKEFGSVEALSVNTTDRIIAVRLQLKGETEPLDVMVSNYRIEKTDGHHAFVFEDVGTSREWVNMLIKRFLTGQRLEIPDAYGDLAERLM